MSDAVPAPDSGETAATATSSLKRWLWWLLAALVLLVGWNAIVAVPVASALDDDSHSVLVYRRWLISPNEIVFDVRGVSDTGSMADMDRQLFKAAEALKDRSYDSVILAYKGSGRFRLDGAHFKQVGKSWSYQNPIYLIRTLTENVDNMDGTPAFGAWTGGWLGVMNKQLQDHNDLHERWYMRPALGLSS
jgi:hypothetical protein